jgi:aspartyl-tRNA(Asn)/glutamyl-tRNA(Gln) amidotransferase subunit B
VSQRSKEESQDYRYFPEPDLPVLHFTQEWIMEIRRLLPELPMQRKERFISQLGIAEKDAQVLVGYKELADYYENVLSELDAWMKAEGKTLTEKQELRYEKLAANWCLGQFLSLLNEHKQLPDESKITPENFAELLKLIGTKKVSQLSAKDIFVKMFETGEDPSNLLESLGLGQVSEEGPLLDAVKKVLAENPKAVEDAKVKGEKAFGFLVGQTMKELKGKGNPQVINELLKKELDV